MVQALLEAHPGAISVPDAKGNLPAHVGAICNADEDVMRILLRAYPAALDKSNGEGKALAALAEDSERTHEWFSALFRFAGEYKLDILVGGSN